MFCLDEWPEKQVISCCIYLFLFVECLIYNLIDLAGKEYPGSIRSQVCLGISALMITNLVIKTQYSSTLLQSSNCFWFLRLIFQAVRRHKQTEKCWQRNYTKWIQNTDSNCQNSSAVITLNWLSSASVRCGILSGMKIQLEAVLSVIDIPTIWDL